MAAKRGEFDVIPSLVPEHWPGQASAPGLAASFAPLELAPPRFRYALFGAMTPPTDDPRVRRALGLLIDREAIASDVDRGLARPIAGPIWPSGPGDGPGPTPPAIDPAAAGRLLDEAGWIDSDGDGLREKAGQKLRLTVLALEGKNGKAAPEVDKALDGLRRANIGLDVRLGAEAVLRNKVDDDGINLAFLGGTARSTAISEPGWSAPAAPTTRGGVWRRAGSIRRWRQSRRCGSRRRGARWSASWRQSSPTSCRWPASSASRPRGWSTAASPAWWCGTAGST